MVPAKIWKLEKSRPIPKIVSYIYVHLKFKIFKVYLYLQVPLVMIRLERFVQVLQNQVKRGMYLA